MDEKISAEGMSFCRGNQYKAEIIDQILAPRTMLTHLVKQGGSSENEGMNIKALEQPFKKEINHHRGLAS